MKESGGASKATIARWLDLSDREAAERAIEAIFFAASGTQSFLSAEARAAFRERWLGRYLVHDPGLVFVALAPEGTIVGYLAGSFDDPARTHRFSDIAYFAEFAPITPAFPAHLHVNLAEGWRGQGIGAALVMTFLAAAHKAGAAGAHVVTGKGLRNAGFYEKLGFRRMAEALSNGKTVVLLGRELGGGDNSG